MENTKKRKSLIVVAMLLLLALIIGMSGFTFARYYTETGEKSNTATVAKWGFVLSATPDNMFGSEYKSAGTNISSTAGTGSVNIQAASNVVAPGSTGTATFSVSGEAEVRAQVKISFVFNGISLTKDGETYDPIVWTLKKGDSVVATGASDIEAYFNTNGVIEPGETTSVAGDYTLVWEWAFNNEGASGITGLTANQADTILGKWANGDQTEGYTADLNLGLTVNMSIEQIHAE